MYYGGHLQCIQILSHYVTHLKLLYLKKKDKKSDSNTINEKPSPKEIPKIKITLDKEED